ncbi:uncharacterized protein BBOV_IV010780 [Babesia bovis T2Bo]|uniref:Uncharacterized protein n=1 Tax=Babesia bovis TaxID=5865 RepID=A7ASB2_BABBO|nr:uncharacterized protein BBOV_IV010780 [Babesia bovis T2Bo]EDO07431.1 hypothetical protein BBOV_IV010780 [Babesia bovis T2Bo]|eukprot:XP_001610999.1 hypothetical protein [Babesia bovis T2Bo]
MPRVAYRETLFNTYWRYRRIVDLGSGIPPLRVPVETTNHVTVTSLHHIDEQVNRIYDSRAVPSFLESLASKISHTIETIVDGLHILLWKGKHFKGCFQPSKWKWYHRHGYWATRKKLLKFDTYRRHRYHEVRGPGKKPPGKYDDKSFYKPLRDSIKFW